MQFLHLSAYTTRKKGRKRAIFQKPLNHIKIYLTCEPTTKYQVIPPINGRETKEKRKKRPKTCNFGYLHHSWAPIPRAKRVENVKFPKTLQTHQNIPRMLSFHQVSSHSAHKRSRNYEKTFFFFFSYCELYARASLVYLALQSTLNTNQTSNRLSTHMESCPTSPRCHL